MTYRVHITMQNDVIKTRASVSNRSLFVSVKFERVVESRELPLLNGNLPSVLTYTTEYKGMAGA